MIAAVLGLLMTFTPADSVSSIDTLSLGSVASVPVVGFDGGGYDALETKGRRKPPPGRITREDNLLNHGRRTKLTASSQDLVRNFSIAGWMIRRHLDYVSLFDFHSRCATDKGLRKRFDVEVLKQLDDDIETLMRQDSIASRFDVGQRCHREKFFRLAEMRRTVDGDLGIVKVNVGTGQLQGIESDLIRNPTDADLRGEGYQDGKENEWVAGVRTGPGGAAKTYAVHRRGRGGAGYTFDRFVPRSNLIHYGYFSRFAGDQTRGVSPITSALNNFRDVYGAFDLALAKMKVSQLFALAIFSNATDAAGAIDLDEEDDEGGRKYNVDFGAGPVHLELDGADRAEFLESKTPSTEMQSFSHLVIAVGLKALDIPYSFYDESHTNFFGSRAAWLHYERSCVDKRDDQIQMRSNYTLWKLRLAIMQGRLTLPAGLTLADVVTEWVPRGMPWWDPAKEIRGDKEAVGAGFDNPERICKRTGMGDVYDNIRATCRVMAEARKISREELGDEYAFVPDYGVKPEIMLATDAKNDAKNKGDDDDA